MTNEISLLVDNLIFFVPFDTNRIYFFNFIVFIIYDLNWILRASTDKISHASLGSFSPFSTHLFTSAPFQAIQLLAHRSTFTRPIPGTLLKANLQRETKETPICTTLTRTYQAKLSQIQNGAQRYHVTSAEGLGTRQMSNGGKMAIRVWWNTWWNTWNRRIITRSRNLGILFKYHTNLWR